MRQPNITQRLPRSKRGADRQYQAILRYVHRHFTGDPFGIDSRTLAVLWAEGFARMVQLERLAPTLPE